MCVYCSKLKENDSKRIYVQINTYRVYIDIHYTFINCSLNSFIRCGFKCIAAENTFNSTLLYM